LKSARGARKSCIRDELRTRLAAIRDGAGIGHERDTAHMATRAMAIIEDQTVRMVNGFSPKDAQLDTSTRGFDERVTKPLEYDALLAPQARIEPLAPPRLVRRRLTMVPDLGAAPADPRHVLAIVADLRAALAPGALRLFGRKFVRGALGVRGEPATAGQFESLYPVQRGESARRCIRSSAANPRGRLSACCFSPIVLPSTNGLALSSGADTMAITRAAPRRRRDAGVPRRTPARGAPSRPRPPRRRIRG
jgi:hypothetical protein